MPIQDKTRANRLGFAYFALLAVTLIVQYTVAALLRRFFPALTETDGYTWLLSLVPLYGVALPVCLALLHNCPAEPIAPRPMRLRFWWLALLLSFGLMFFGNLIGNALMMLIAALRGVEMINPVQELILDADPLWTALATVIAAPLGEEFIFRRLIIDHARSFGELPAILLSAAMFGAFHQNFYQFFYAFSSALFWAMFMSKPAACVTPLPFTRPSTAWAASSRRRCCGHCSHCLNACKTARRLIWLC